MTTNWFSNLGGRLLRRARLRRIVRRVPVLAAALTLASTSLPSYAQDGYKPIRPMESRSNAIGLIDQVPVVNYNEYSGNVSVDLSVGVEGLTLPIHYSNQERSLGDVFPLPKDEVMGGRSLGAGWYMGYGVISPSGHERTHYQIYENLPPTEFDRVLYREPNGAENEFKVDLFFQQIPNEDDWYNFHFVDSGFRRLERKLDPRGEEFGSDEFALLGRDGSRTIFKAKSTSARGMGFFYPIEIEQANGRKMTLSYCDSSGEFPNSGDLKTLPAICNSAPTMLLHTVSDDWGRSLKLHYGTRPTGAVVLNYVSLETGGQASQTLATFRYEEVLQGGIQVTELRGQKTPLQYETEFRYERQFTTGDQQVNLSRVKLPTGGEVTLQYTRADQYYCPNILWDGTSARAIPAKRRARVSRLSYGGETYAYTYQQGYELGPLFDGSWIVSMRSTQSEVPYERLTHYAQAPSQLVGPPSNRVGYCWPDLAVSSTERIAGRPLRRLECYGGPTGGDSAGPTDGAFRAVNGGFTFNPGGSHRREIWNYQLQSLRSASNPVPPGSGEVRVWIPLVDWYDVTRDGRHWSTDFDYSVQAPGIFVAPEFDQPRSITLTRGDVPGPSLKQVFEYESRVVSGHDLQQVIADQPHVLTLTTAASEFFTENGEENQVRGESYQFEAGRHPRLLDQLYSSSPDDAEFTRFSYYAAGPFRGMPETQTRVGDNPNSDQTNLITQFQQYQFGQASLIQPPTGPVIDRQINPDGTLAEETKAGVRTIYSYDADRRVRFVEVPGSGQNAVETVYSAHTSLPTTKTERSGNRELMVEVADPWGRVIEKRSRIDGSTMASTHTHYDPLGLVASEVNAHGAVRSFTYDVLGRQRSIRTHDAQGTQLEKVDISFSAIPGGPERRTETLWKVGTSAFTQRITDSDFFGRQVRAATKTHNMPEIEYPNHQTLFNFAFVDGLQRKLIRPGVNELRLEEHDWFGRLTMECHPEMSCQVEPQSFTTTAGSLAPVEHAFDPFGRPVRTTHSDGSSTVSFFDSLNRLTALEEVSAAGERQRTVFNTYNSVNNQLETSTSSAEGLDVEVTQDNFDALQRPLSTSIDIPQAYPAPYELAPSQYWIFGDSLPLTWTEASFADRYEVVFQRGAGSANSSASLVFETTATELELTEAVIRQAVAALPDPSSAASILSDLDIDPDFLLDPEIAYRWRVYGWRGLEPTLASPWQVLDESIGPDDCHFTHFRVRDGVNEGALVEWQTSNCSEGGPLSVQILSSSVEAEAGCEFEDAVFSGDKVGPRRALFMITGYDLVDGQPEFPADFNTPQCPGLEQASFRGVIVDPDGNTVHEVGPMIGHVLTGDICDVRNVNIIDGLNGTAPVVRWETSDCTNEIVEVLAEAEVDPTLPNAEQCRFPGALATGYSGQVSADFMIDGYTVNGQACAPVERAWFWVRIKDPVSSGVFETSPQLGYVEPVGGFPAGCYTRLFTESSAPGIVPIVAWEARNCEGMNVEVTRTAVGVPSNLNCLIRNDLWQTESFGVRDARFMIEGFTGIGGAACDPVADMLAVGEDRVEFDFSINIVDPQTGLYIEPQTSIKKTLRATYTLPPTGSSSGPCRIDFLGVTNGFFGHQPLATWGTSGTCSEVKLKVWTDPYLDPVNCRLYEDENNEAVWSTLPDGPVHLGFMVGGYDENLDDDYNGQMDCRGEPGGNGTYGEALTKAFVALVAKDVNGSMVREPAEGGLLVRNHNDQSQSSLPGPEDPCEIIDFAVDQPALPGQQATDTLPTIRWRTNCPAESLYSVRVYANAQSTDNDPVCRLDDSVLAASKNGPHPAVFLRTGWWDRVTGTKRCFAHRATIHMEIVDDANGTVLPGQTAGPIEVIYSGEHEGSPPIGSCEGNTCSTPNCQYPIPIFAGLNDTPEAGPNCLAELTWDAGTSNCGGGLSYKVYRSSTPIILQEEGYLLAENLTGTSFVDTDIVNGGSYYYMVSAKDSASGVESGPTLIRRLENNCTQGQHAFWVDPPVVQAGQTATLHWNFPEAMFLFLVGYGEQAPEGQLQVQPSASSNYQMHVSFGSGSASFLTGVEVQGATGPPPEPEGSCNNPCAESVIIDGKEYFCRGFGAWDGTYEVTQDPEWLSVADWENYVLNDLGEPISPFCLKAVCGDGSFAPYGWHPPDASPSGWIPESDLPLTIEFPGDGLDNDCDAEIDE